MGRERGYPLGVRGSPCDADYEDGSVPSNFPYPAPITCIEARREGCHLREIEWGSDDERDATLSF